MYRMIQLAVAFRWHKTPWPVPRSEHVSHPVAALLRTQDKVFMEVHRLKTKRMESQATVHLLVEAVKRRTKNATKTPTTFFFVTVEELVKHPNSD
jgi:hypothetical protein